MNIKAMQRATVNSVPRPVRRGFDDVIRTLDEIGFDVGSYHVSLWTALKVVLVALIVIVAARVLTRMVRGLFARMTALDTAQRVLADKFVGIVVWTVALLVGLDVLGINLTALTVFSGAIGLAVGFGLQKSFGNMIAGIILLMDRSIKPGDVIAVAGTNGQNSFGQVNKIGFRAASVTTRDGREYLIPNENLMTSQVENWSYSSREVGITIPLGVAYGCDIDEVERLMLQAVAEVPRILADPEPSVLMTAFGTSSIDMAIMCWISDPELGVLNVKSQVLKGCWRLFREHGIEVPFPQQDVNLRYGEGLQALAEALAQRGPAAEGGPAANGGDSSA